MAYKFRLELNYHSNRIEGGTLTKLETRSIMIGLLTVDGKPLKDVREMKGHDDVIKAILKQGKAHLRLSENRSRKFTAELSYLKRRMIPAKLAFGKNRGTILSIIN